MILISEVIVYDLNHGCENMGEEEFYERCKPIGKEIPRLRRLLYSSAIYTTPTISHTIKMIVDFVLEVNVVKENIEQFVNELRDAIFQVAGEFYTAYLK